ncbi:hypothetical protein AVEN_124425-1 [Araneus ventricosus]|uniref:Low-density lipoprotein receptor-related protein 2 n=1 Tax=Araneus ventricosus TaxID=182803 RepID=A0A4Y2KAJ2_ARAVE|nr:hypothetical protein AVEN_124425-1 [Araneus ventricosus]
MEEVRAVLENDNCTTTSLIEDIPRTAASQYILEVSPLPRSSNKDTKKKKINSSKKIKTDYTSNIQRRLASVPCSPSVFKCFNGKCVQRSWFCDNGNDCGDNSDERYCAVDYGTPCPSGWVLCPNMQRCIPGHWMCDGITDCREISEETNCDNDVMKIPGVAAAKIKLQTWFLQKRKESICTDKWGPQIHRIAVALHLADESTFDPGNNTGDEIRYELTIQLLHRHLNDKKMNSQELSLYIHAMLVACMDPKDFYGDNLVLELRRRVEAAGNYTNPFQILALCNAEDTMTAKDVERVTAAFDSQYRPFWIDLQALASMALACISSRTKGIVDESVLDRMLQELKRHQFRNGTVDNFRTTALATQALFVHDSYKKEFDLNAAIQVLIDGLNENYSLLDAYYALPVFHAKSLLNITSDHCSKGPDTEEEALQKALDVDGETMAVQYSVWMGDKINLAQTWRLRVRTNSTIYAAIETVAKIDNRQKVKYSIVDGKPYVNAVNGLEDDPEMGIYWFIYLRSSNFDEQPKIVEESMCFRFFLKAIYLPRNCFRIIYQLFF